MSAEYRTRTDVQSGADAASWAAQWFSEHPMDCSLLDADNYQLMLAALSSPIAIATLPRNTPLAT